MQSPQCAIDFSLYAEPFNTKNGRFSLLHKIHGAIGENVAILKFLRDWRALSISSCHEVF